MGCGSAAAKEPAKQAPAAGQPPNRGQPTTAAAPAPVEVDDGKRMIYNKETGMHEEAKDNLEKKDRPDVRNTYNILG